MAGGGDPWNEEQPWHHQPGPFGLFLAFSSFCIFMGIVGDIRAGVVAAVLGGLFGFFMWCRNGFGWRIEAAERDRIDRGEPEFDNEWAKRAILWVVAGVVAFFAMAWIFS